MTESFLRRYFTTNLDTPRAIYFKEYRLLLLGGKIKSAILVDSISKLKFYNRHLEAELKYNWKMLITNPNNRFINSTLNSGELSLSNLPK